MGKTVSIRFPGCFNRTLFILGGKLAMTYIKAWMSSKFDQIRPRTIDLADIERLKKIVIQL